MIGGTFSDVEATYDVVHILHVSIGRYKNYKRIPVPRGSPDDILGLGLE